MSSPSQPSRTAIADVHADAADQFLISYLTMTRLKQCSPYAILFTLGHCIELSIKAVFWSQGTKKTSKKP